MLIASLPPTIPLLLAILVWAPLPLLPLLLVGDTFPASASAGAAAQRRLLLQVLLLLLPLLRLSSC
jgi:hypothetical protein